MKVEKLKCQWCDRYRGGRGPPPSVLEVRKVGTAKIRKIFGVGKDAVKHSGKKHGIAPKEADKDWSKEEVREVQLMMVRIQAARVEKSRETRAA